MGNPPELYYELLNITRDTPPQEIRAAYRCLVRQWHPDKHPPSSKSEAEDRFKAITQAYEVRCVIADRLHVRVSSCLLFRVFDACITHGRRFSLSAGSPGPAGEQGGAPGAQRRRGQEELR